MKKTILAVIGFILSSPFIGVSNAYEIQFGEINQFDQFGLKSDDISKLFYNDFGIILGEEEFLLIDEDTEGENIKFETLDGHIINISIDMARSSWNKVTGGQ